MQQLPSRLKDARGRALLSRHLGTGPLPPPEWWDASLKGKITFPEWRLFREYWRAATATPVDFSDRLKCYGILGAWLLLNVPKLARDVIIALEQLVTPTFDRVRAGGLRAPKSA
jgi:hypothetical protein